MISPDDVFRQAHWFKSFIPSAVFAHTSASRKNLKLLDACNLFFWIKQSKWLHGEANPQYCSQHHASKLPSPVKNRVLDGMRGALIGAHLPWPEKAVNGLLGKEAVGAYEVFGLGEGQLHATTPRPIPRR